VPAVARAAQPHIAEALPAGVFARLPLVEQARRVRQLPEPGEQAVLRPPLDGEPVALNKAPAATTSPKSKPLKQSPTRLPCRNTLMFLSSRWIGNVSLPGIRLLMAGTMSSSKL